MIGEREVARISGAWGRGERMSPEEVVVSLHTAAARWARSLRARIALPRQPDS